SCMLLVRLPTLLPTLCLLFFFSTTPATTQIYTLSLHDALPISATSPMAVTRTTPRSPRSAGSSETFQCSALACSFARAEHWKVRSEEHTSELQSRGHLVCRLLLEKKKKKKIP